jgi:hypothetical protein
MSPLGKILLYVALAGGIAAAVGGYLNYTARKADAQTLTDTVAAKNASDTAAKKAQAEAAAEKQAETDAETKVTTANSTIDDLKTQLTTAQKQAADATAAVQTANDAATAAKTQLDAINKTLNGATADQLVADKAKADSDLQAAQAEQKIIQDQLQASTAQIATLQDAINRSKNNGQMPGVSGKVTFVDHAWNFVILDVGLNSGVVPNGELIVYRGKNFLGKVRVTKVDPSDSVAEILPDIKGDIQIGDAVLN